MIQVEQVADIRTLGQERQSGQRMAGKERDHLPRIARQSIERQAILELAQVKSGRHAQSPCHTIHLSKDFRQIHEYLDGWRESHALGAGEIAIGAPVRTESVGGEVPIIRTTVAFFRALPNRAAMFGQHQGSLALVMQLQRIRRAQGDAIVRSIQRLDHFSAWIRRADGFRQSLTGSRCVATPRQDDASWREAIRRPRTVGRQRRISNPVQAVATAWDLAQ